MRITVAGEAYLEAAADAACHLRAAACRDVERHLPGSARPDAERHLLDSVRPDAERHFPDQVHPDAERHFLDLVHRLTPLVVVGGAEVAGEAEVAAELLAPDNQVVAGDKAHPLRITSLRSRWGNASSSNETIRAPSAGLIL